MSKVYFISDPHFGHNNLCKNVRHMTTQESDELIISNWNSIVTKHDTVYIIGDITMENHKIIEGYIKRLNGTIVVIGGNHDNKQCCHKLQELGIIVMGVLEYKGYIVTHIPISKESIKECRGNIHGHIHSYELPYSKYISVVPELNNYTPLSLDDIIEKQKKKHKILTYIKLYIKRILYKITKCLF